MTCQKENLRKKYPISPTHLQTDRKHCLYCPSTVTTSELVSQPINQDNANKCATCGIGSVDFIRGHLLGLSHKTNLPMAIVERIGDECSQYTRDEIDNRRGKENESKEYYIYDGKVYHLLSMASATWNISFGPCSKQRKEKAWLDKECIDCDIKHAILAFEAIDKNKNNFFTPYPKRGEAIFEYHDYLCKKSSLREIMIPLYARQDFKIDRNKRGLMGILIIGQVAITKTARGEGDELKRYHEGLTKKNQKVIEKLRKNAQIDAPKFITVHEALEKHEKNIVKYLRSIHDRVILRETDFLQLYQSKLIQKYVSAKSQAEQEGVEERVKLENCIKQMFEQIAQDFDIKHMFMFFPDIASKIIMETTGVVSGIDLTNDSSPNEAHTMEIDLKKFPAGQKEHKVEITELRDSGCLTWKKGDIVVEMPTQKFGGGYYACYATKERDPVTFFGIFYEWMNPSQDGASRTARKAFFDALVSVCLADIMAYVAKIRSERLRSFAETTRHDLAQRLQSFLTLNNSFYKNCISVKKEQMSINLFLRHCQRFYEDNLTMYESLAFLRETLDDPELRFLFEPKQFDPYTSLLHRFKQVLSAPWHKFNKGHRVILGEYPLNIWNTYADQIMFYRIMLNLLENTLKHSLVDTNIYIQPRVDSSSRCCYFDVINFGAGVPESQKDSIFDTGGRTMLSKNANIDGQGIGLAISKEFAKHHGGDLYIASGLTRGTYTQEQKEANGWISDINVGYFRILQRIIRTESNPNPRYSELYLEAQREIERLQALPHTHNLVKLAKSFGKKDVFDFIMAEQKDDFSYLDTGDIDYSPRRVSRGQSKPLYMITFTLKLPMQK